MNLYQFLSWVSAMIAVSSIYFAGKKLWWAWLLYMANSGILLAINIHYKLWGFIPLCIITFGMYVRNARKWYINKEIQGDPHKCSQ